MYQSACIVRECLKEPKFTCSCNPGLEICLKHIYWHLQSSNFPLKLHSFTEICSSQTSPKEIAIEFLESYKADLKKLKELYYIEEGSKVNRIKSNLNEFQTRLNREVNSVESFRKRIVNADESWLEKSSNLMIRKLAKKVNKDLFMQCDGPILSIEKTFSASIQSQQIKKTRKYNSFSSEQGPVLNIQSQPIQQTRKYNLFPWQSKTIAISYAVLILSIICWNLSFTSKKTMEISISPEEVSIIFDHSKEQLASLTINPENYLIINEVFENLNVINDFFSREPRNFENSTLCHSECLSISQEHKVYYRKFYGSYFYGYWNVVYKGSGIYIFDIKEGETSYFGVSFFENGEKYVGYFAGGTKKTQLDFIFEVVMNDILAIEMEDLRMGMDFILIKMRLIKEAWLNGSGIDGTILNGLWTGSGTLYFPNGDTYQGQFKDSKAEGSGKYIWNSTKIIYEGQFNNGWRKDTSKWYKDCKNNLIIGKQVLESKLKVEFNSNDEECKYTAILEDPDKVINISKDITTLSFNKNRPIVRNRSS